MNKAELVLALSAKCNFTHTQAACALDGFLDIVKETLAEGDDIVLVGFGSFTVGERAARTGRNPQTGATIEIAASKVVKFSAGTKLKDAVNGNKR